MSPEARREMIVAHTIPLLTEHGPAVTTQLIAQVAGIGEATIFRAFEDKAALLRACMMRVVSPEPLVAALAGIPPDVPLEQRLADAARLLNLHAGRVGTVMEALVVAGIRLHRDEMSGQDARKAMHEGRSRSMAVIADAIAELIQPDAVRFRVPVAGAAMSFQFLVMALMRRPFGRGGTEDGPVAGGLEVEDVVDLFLHGALSKTAENQRNGEDIAC